MPSTRRQKPDRTKLDKLFRSIKSAGAMDLRVGQLFEILRKENGDDLFYVENDALSKLIDDYVKRCQRLKDMKPYLRRLKWQ